ncbi:MAG: tetratricopeptide repeat protein [Sedimentisphaerales bacterium]|nr:tetratricopeptide repeat protein [Sedimentisphaerales bacterium]
MNDESSIYDAEPENLDRLVFEILGEQEEEDSGAAVTANGVLEQPGDRIGRYKLLNVLGEGGMGMVYLAEQEGQIRRKVALKVIKPGMDSKRVIARFETERQALALLDHPGVAQVYDAGTTEAGRPYFVMEHVRGLPITDYCDRHKLTVEQRLRLFQQVCLAVHHAHQKGIIHRDIKPSNILVSAENDRPIPKIIDFGVAKAISQPLTERTLFTEDSQLLGTPEYMSPEQADMSNEDIDTRSDIYSLGVLLYVLLAGILPYDSKTFREGGVEHIRKVIRETDPKTPSTRLTKLGEEVRKLAENRRMEIHALARHLKKELEWIPLKAMRKERSERYRSASELSDDIENYLNGEPLIAGPLSKGYRLKKFVRRNRALVASVASIIAVLAVGVVVSMLFAIGQARARAEARAFADFLQNGIEALTLPGQAKGTEVSLQDLLTVWSKKLEGRFEDKPLIEASIRATMGWAYRYIYEPKAAELHLERALQIRREQLGPGHPQTLSSADRLVWLRWDQGRYAEAAELAEDALSTSRRVLGDEHDVTLTLVKTLGNMYGALGRYDEAEQLYLSGLQAARRAKSNVNMMGNLAGVYMGQGRYDEAERLYLESIALDHGDTDDEDSETAGTTRKNFLASVYIDQKQYIKAKELFLEILPIQRRELGNQHWHTLRSANWLAQVHMHLGEFDEAETLLREVLDVRKLKLGEDHPWTLKTINDLGVLRREQKRYDEAETLLRQALEGRKRMLGPGHPACFGTLHELSVLYKEQARYEEAQKYLLEALEGRRLELGDKHPHTKESLNTLIALYDAWGKPEQAEQWRERLPIDRHVK